MSWTSLKKSELIEYTITQINHLFPDKYPLRRLALEPYMDDVLYRTNRCLSKIKRPQFHKNGEAYFDHLHANAYSMYLYLLGNTIYRIDRQKKKILNKIFFLNRALCGVDVLYDTPLQEYFYFSRPLGTTLANRAKYGNYFVVLQGCTVGGGKGGYPSIGECVVLYTNSSVLGGCNVGNNVRISANSSIYNKEIPNNTTVFGMSTKNSFGKTDTNMIEQFFY